MTRIEFSLIEELPDRLLLDRGPASRRFLEKGIKSFRDAAEFVRAMPYGPNPGEVDLFALFRDGCGTCLSKHRLIAELAEETGLPVVRTEGIYRLDDSILPGVSLVLNRYNLNYIPRIHCFLQSGDRYFDLTEGNCTGKSGLIHRYILIYPADREEGVIDERGKFLKYWEELFGGDNTFNRLGIESLMKIAEECSEHLGLCRLDQGAQRVR